MHYLVYYRAQVLSADEDAGRAISAGGRPLVATASLHDEVEAQHYKLHCIVHHMVHYMVHCIVHYMVHYMVHCIVHYIVHYLHKLVTDFQLRAGTLTLALTLPLPLTPTLIRWSRAR